MLAFIALGSNLDNPKNQIEKAVESLANSKGVKFIKNSSLYISKPWLNMLGENYLNSVCKISTTLEPLELLDLCHSIEKQQDRIRDVRWGPRTIDLDILLFGDIVYQDSRLTIPHPHMLNRCFVILPLYEIEPNLKVVNHGYLRDYLHKVDLKEIKKYESD